MATNKKKSTKLLIVLICVITTLILGAFLIINQRNSIIENIILSKLAKQGFNEARIEKLNISSKNLKLYNLKLSETIHIGYLQANYKTSTNVEKPIIIDNVVLDKVTFLYTKDSNEPKIDPIDILKETLSKNMPIENITIKMAKITIASEHGIPVESIRFRNTRLKINSIEQKVNVTGKLNLEGEMANIYANFTADADVNGNINFGYEIKKGDFVLPNFKGKRLTGWSEFSYKDNKLNSQASINIGSTSIVGIPFRGITITYKDTPNKMLLINGRSLGDIAEFSLSLNISKPDKNNNSIIEGKLDISAKELEKLPKLVEQNKPAFPLDDIFKTISGSANIRLNFKGQKLNNTITDIFTGWTKFQGSISASLLNLTVEPYLKQTDATLQASIFPLDNGLKIIPKTLNIKGQANNKNYSLKIQGSESYSIINKSWKYALIHVPPLSLSYDGITANIQKGKINIYNDRSDGTLNAIFTPPNNLLTPIYADIFFNYSKEKSIHFNVKAKDKTKNISAKITGDFSTIDGKGNITIDVPPINFSINGVQPYDLSPKLKDVLKETSGTIGLNAEISLPKKTATGSLLIKNISTDYNGNSLKNLNATIKIDSLSPFKVNNQKIALESFNAGIPFYNGLVTFSYDSSQKESLYIKDAGWKMAGGKVYISDLKINPSNPNSSFDINISDVALQQLFTLAPLDGLEATGIVGGKLPVSIQNGDIIIKNGNLTTTTKGKISYAPKDMPSFLQDSANQNIIYLRQVLNNFHYSDLSFIINGKAGSEQEIKLRVEGRNPELTGQRPVILNLNLQGALENILNQQTKAYTMPDNISEQIKEYEENNAKKN